MRIGIDARPIHLPGIGRYISELLRHLAKVDARNQYLIYFSSPEYINAINFNNPNFRPVLVPSNIYTISEQVYMPYRIKKDRLDIFHSTTSLSLPLIKVCPSVITFHDMLLKVHQEFIPSKVAWAYFNIVNWRAIRSSDKIITVSHFTANELTSFYPEVKSKITTIHSGFHEKFHPVRDARLLEDVKARYGIQGEYFLYVGTYKKHKNLPALVNAYAGLPDHIRDRYLLLIVGKQDRRYPEVPELIKHLNLRERVFCINYVSEEDLPALYSAAAVFIFMSIYEGFGLPLVEAIACGIPVVASRIPVFSEIVGESAILVDPCNISEIRDAICEIVSNRHLASILRGKSLQRSEDFSWYTTAQRVLNVYESLYPGKGSKDSS